MMTVIRTRKALGTMIREALEEQGKPVVHPADPQGWGRLLYEVDGVVCTPGEAAARLGIEF